MPRTELPSMVMSPSVMSIRRLTIFIAVVLPPPDGPTSTQISPAGTARDRLLTAGTDRPAYRLVTRSKTSSAAPPPPPTEASGMGRPPEDRGDRHERAPYARAPPYHRRPSGCHSRVPVAPGVALGQAVGAQETPRHRRRA